MIKKDLSAAWLLDITHTQTHTDEGCPAKFELQISNKYFSIQVFPVQYWGHTYTKRLFVVHAKLLQSCLTLSDPMDCSLPGSSVHGILQAGTLEWVAISSSRGSS